MSLTNASPADAAVAAKSASHMLSTLPAADRNAALTAMHAGLAAARDEILAANARDLDLARRAAADGELAESLVARLDLKRRWEDMLQGMLDVRDLPDAVGRTTLRTKLDDGLVLERVTCPIGVLLVIFEARPEVLANIAALAIKSANAAILKGGKESTETLVAMSRAMAGALAGGKVPADAVQLVTTRDSIPALLALDRHVDLVMPRGGNELVRYVKERTKIPVLGHAHGLCSIYLEASADAGMACRVLVDAKASYPAACNAVETLLVQDKALAVPWPQVAEALLAAGVELRCDERSLAALVHAGVAPCPAVMAAGPADFDTEFLAPVLAVKTLDRGLDEAVAHINAHGSRHTEAILTSDADAAERFMAGVDSAGAYWNASTRFADGTRYGFGTEVGISTNKIHARGPVGLEGLMIYKYKIRGAGQTACEYGEGKKSYVHEELPL